MLFANSQKRGVRPSRALDMAKPIRNHRLILGEGLNQLAGKASPAGFVGISVGMQEPWFHEYAYITISYKIDTATRTTPGPMGSTLTAS
jgi:hypothetical protein